MATPKKQGESAEFDKDLERINELARRLGTDRIRIILDIIDQNTADAFKLTPNIRKKPK